MKILILLFTGITCVYSCISIQPYKTSYNKLPLEIKEKIQQNGRFTLKSTNTTFIDFTKDVIDSLKATKAPTILFVCHMPNEENLELENVKKFDSLQSIHGYKSYITSLGYDNMLFYNIERTLQHKPQTVFVVNNKDFGTGVFAKPKKFTEYILSKEINEKDSHFFWYYIVLNNAKDGSNNIHFSLQELKKGVL